MKKQKIEKPIPDEVLIPAINATLRTFVGMCADKWGELERSYCRSVCGEQYRFVETDWIGHAAIRLRKSGKCDSVNGGPKRKQNENPSGAYAEYLASDHWKSIRTQVLQWWGNKCCLCKEKATEVHHNSYERSGREDLTDLVAVCRVCHKRIHGRMPSGNSEFKRNRK